MTKLKVILEDCLFYQPTLNITKEPYCDILEKNITCCNSCRYYTNYKKVKNMIKTKGNE